MLDIERSAGVKATYNVLGCLLPDVRGRIEADGHALGFHSYDHSIDRWWPVSQWGRRIRRRLLGGTGAARRIDQLTSCREVDYRIRGYRPPQSRITRELGDANLCWHNFEWFASSTHSLHVEKPALRHRMVRIPILTDDHSLYTRKTSWPDWEAHVLHEASGATSPRCRCTTVTPTSGCRTTRPFSSACNGSAGS